MQYVMQCEWSLDPFAYKHDDDILVIQYTGRLMVFTYIRFNRPFAFAYQYLFSPFHIGSKLKPSFITNLRPYKVC